MALLVFAGYFVWFLLGYVVGCFSGVCRGVESNSAVWFMGFELGTISNLSLLSRFLVCSHCGNL